MKKRNFRYNRILSAVLAFVLFFGVLPLNASSSNNEETVQTEAADNSFLSVTMAGQKTSLVELHAHEKHEIQVQSNWESAQYQWQILHPEKEDTWINIGDATEETIPVTLALVGNMLNEENVAQLRCRITAEGAERFSVPVTVQYLEEDDSLTVVQDPEPTTEATELTTEATDPTTEATAPTEETEPATEASDSTEEPTVPASPEAEVVAAPENPQAANNISLDQTNAEIPEFVTVEIHYELYQYFDGEEQHMGEAFSDYIATLKSETDFETSVHCPTIVGYEPTLVKVIEGGVERDPRAEEFDEEEKTVEINQPDITVNVVYRVEYRPALVSYKVQYFFQNIYDDLYVEDANIHETVNATGKTGYSPDLKYVQAKFDGFTSLYYEPENIAADGSTVFHVYYERNYYLMEFDCNGGYGTDTLYVRYGTYISVPNPVKSGYTFAGWDLERSENSKAPVTQGDGKVDTLPANMPPYNTAYKAVWDQADTTYSIAYWIVNDDGTTSFLGNRRAEGLSGTTVSGPHDLKSKDEGGPTICGSEEHTHTDACYTCGITAEHEHTRDACFKDMALAGNDPGDDGREVIKTVDDGKTNPESGYIYVIRTDQGNLWPKLYLNGNYYTVNGAGAGDTPATEDQVTAIIDGGPLGTGAYGNLTVTKYRPKTSCGVVQHIHNNSCRKCEEHTHSEEKCYQDDKYLVPVTDELKFTIDGKQVTYKTDTGVTIEGDGSTVVNVYYQYKEYTLKFYYAATTGGTANDNDRNAETYDSIKIVGGTSYYFGSWGDNTSNDETLLENEYWNHKDQWGAVSELPSLNKRGTERKYDSGSVVYRHDGTDVTYHYISFKARYGDDISGMWPCAVFNSATRTDKNNSNGWNGTEAFVSAWNGEHHVKYSQDNSNETIKGVYELLDENLLFHSDYNDEQEVSYLCFWENGANIGWSVPELYRYNIYLEKRSSQDMTGLTTIEKNDGVTYYLADSYDTCDNSNVGEQTQVSLTGYAEKTFGYNSHLGYKYEKVKDSNPPKYFEYKVLSGTTDAEQLKDKSYYDSSLYREGYEVNFYYTANRHSLKFYNHNGWLGEGKGAGNTQEGEGVQYGTPLKNFGAYVNDEFMAEHYPGGLEPGAYQFDGWYTTELFLEGTEVDWDTMTMPDDDVIVYAKWTPVVHDVYFYYLYDDMAANKPWTTPTDEDGKALTDKDGNPITISYPIKAEHGIPLGTSYNYTPVRWEDENKNGVIDDDEERYTFAGWFYIDDTGKKRFAPDTMEIKKDMRLFAEWQSSIDTQYTVTYVLDTAATIDGKSYPANTEIALPTAGHLTAGKTKTFNAKVGTELLSQFRDAPLFPLTNSHSILMDKDMNENGFEFRYVVDDEVYYKVRYVNKITGEDLADEKIARSNKAIVTEKFVTIPGYIPENYYIRKVLASDGNDGSEENVSELNEIIFYYNPDEDHGLYVVEYYTEELGGSGDFDDESSWHLEQSLLGSDDLKDEQGNPIVVDAEVDPNKFNGFTYTRSVVTTYVNNTTDGEETVFDEEHDDFLNPSGTLTAYGLEIRVYYTRNSYPYSIRFVEYGTGKILGYGQLDPDGKPKLNTDNTYVFSEIGEQKDKFESTVSYTAPDSITKTEDGATILYNFYATDEKKQTQTHDIRASANGSENILTFYYKPKEVKINYKAVCKHDGATSFGAVNMNYETVTTTKTISGANATPGTDYEFVGWYVDEDCTTAVNKAWRYDPETDAQSDTGTKLKPGTLDTSKEEVTYYALFEPVKENLKIIKSDGDNKENKLSDDTFLFKVTGTNVLGQNVDMIVSIQGEGSVTIKDLYCGTYTVEELTAWSWTYTCNSSVSQSVTLTNQDKDTDGKLLANQIETYDLTFTNSPNPVDWLQGESPSIENQFKIITIPVP